MIWVVTSVKLFELAPGLHKGESQGDRKTSCGAYYVGAVVTGAGRGNFAPRAVRSKRVWMQ